MNMSSAPLLIEAILGSAGDDEWSHRLHHLGHDGAVETLAIAPADLSRRRFRGTTVEGTECAISLPRSLSLFDGAVLYHEGAKAIVLRVGEQAWLRLRPRGPAEALELGYHAGNLHWRVRFEGGDLLVATDGPQEAYLARIAGMIEGGHVLRLP